MAGEAKTRAGGSDGPAKQTSAETDAPCNLGWEADGLMALWVGMGVIREGGGGSGSGWSD